MSIRETVREWLFPKEERSSINDPHLWPTVFGDAYTSQSNINVTPDTAMKLSAVYACVRVIAEAIASIPLQTFKRKAGGKELGDTHDLYYLLHDQPNPEQTSFEFREMTASHLLLRGNAYSYLEWNGAERVSSITPLNPTKMKVERYEGTKVYRYLEDDGKEKVYPPESIWHIPGLSFDGLTGISPIQYARDSIGLGLAADLYASKHYANMGRIGVALSYPGKLPEDVEKKMKETIRESYSGTNAYSAMILQGGLTVEKIGMTHNDAQFIENRAFTVEEIARIFKVPTILIGHPDKAATYASVEQQMISFVTHTIRPWTARMEQSAQKSLLKGRDQKRYFVEFNLNDFVKGDIQTRFAAYSLGRQWGFLSINDIRRLENWNDIPEGGDEYLHPLNMRVIGEPMPVNNNGKGGQDGN